MPPVLYLKSDRGEATIPLDRLPCVLGRSSECTVVVHGNDISRRHAQVGTEGETFFVEDCGSRNGTFLNGSRVSQRRYLKDGDIITLGTSSEFTFRMDRASSGSFSSPVSSQGGRTAITRLHDLKSLEILLEVSRTLNSTLDYTEVLRRVIDAVVELTRVERGFLLMRQSDGSHKVVIARNHEKMPLGEHEIRVSSSMVQQIINAHEPMLMYNPLSDSTFAASESISALSLQTILGVPLQVFSTGPDGNQVLREIGIIYADSTRVAPAEAQHTLDILSALAGHAANAIENARLHQELLIKERMEQDLKIARDIQQSLYPQKFPERFGITFAALSVPLKLVGGDYFDFVDLPDGRLGIAVGDVTGKGIPAALMMTALQSSLWTLCSEARRVSESVATLNRVSARKAAQNRFVTFVYGVLDAERRLTYTNAGHNPPLLVRKNGSIIELKEGGMLLGVAEDVLYLEETLQLETGDCLLLYTDGLVESVNAENEQFGEERVYAILKQEHHRPAKEVVELLAEAVKNFCGDVPLKDDLTLVVAAVGKPEKTK